MISLDKIIKRGFVLLLVFDCLLAGILYFSKNYFEFSMSYQNQYSIELLADKKENTFRVEVNHQDISDELQSEYPALAPHMVTLVSWTIIGLIFLGIASASAAIAVFITLVVAIILLGRKFYQKRRKKRFI